MSQVLTPELKSEFLGLIGQTREEYAKQMEEKARGIIDPIREEVMRKMDDRIDAIEARIQAAGGAKADSQDDERVSKLFGELMRKGDGFRAPADAPQAFKDITTTPDPSGGYLMPAPTAGRIVSLVRETTPMRQFATVVQLRGDMLEGLIDNDEAETEQVSETGTRNTTATPELGRYRIEAFEQSALARISQRALDDLENVDQWLTNKLSNKFGRQENRQFFRGNGVSEARGLCTYSTTVTTSYTNQWSTFEHWNTGVNASFAASNPADILHDIVGSLKVAYLSNARWFMPRRVVTLVRKFKQGADQPYLWQPSLIAGQPSTLVGYPLIAAEDMPELANGSLSAAFGDMRETYTIVDRLGMRMLRDPFSAKPFIQFYATKRTGGGVVNFESLKFIRFGA